jgi:isopentenyl diphosphate isomerase/L-lactate dehydrogenase-like FMN-dependent dehydrogenase
VGRDLLRAAVGAGKEGVALQMRYFAADLARAMKMTGCADLNSISPDALFDWSIGNPKVSE